MHAYALQILNHVSSLNLPCVFPHYTFISFTYETTGRLQLLLMMRFCIKLRNVAKRDLVTISDVHTSILGSEQSVLSGDVQSTSLRFGCIMEDSIGTSETACSDHIVFILLTF